MMLAMPFNNSTDTTGKVVLLKFVRIDLPALDLVLAVVAALVEDVAVLVVDLEAVAVGLVVVVDLAVDSEEVVVVDLVVDSEEVDKQEVTMEEQQLQPLHPTHSPTMLLLAPIEARSSMFAM